MNAPGPRELWERLGGQGSPPGTLGRARGPLLVIGTARCVWDDLARYVAAPGCDAMAVNDAIEHYPRPLRHCLSLYPELLPGWMMVRATRFHGVDGRPPDTHSYRGGHIDRVWPPGIVGGTSGLAAALVGLMLGHEAVILAGVPLTDTGHYYEPPAASTGAHGRPAHRAAWEQARDELFGGRVTSLSGWTRELLGSPGQAAGLTGELATANSPEAPQIRR